MANGESSQQAVNHNTAIDWLKAFAVFLVMNSHMGMCYPKIQFLATGGAIGDALFFFASGFTLFLGRKMSFDNWYKRRINRIYPSIIATAIIAWAIWDNQDSIGDILLSKRYWFIGCILIYYILLYPIKNYKDGALANISMIVGGFIACILYFAFFNNGIPFYSDGLYRCIAFFLIMLQGAIIGKNAKNMAFRPAHIGLLLVSVAFFYLFFYLGRNNWLILFSFVALLGITYYTYLLCCAPLLRRLYENKWVGQLIFIVSQCCLEVYLIQKYVFTEKLNDYFPLNIPLIMLAVLLAAYIVKTIAQFISQTFRSEPYSWNKMLCRR